MASTYSTNLQFELITKGERDGTWGGATNVNWQVVDQSISGVATETLASAGSSGAPNSLPITQGATSTGRNKLIIFDDGGDLGATAYVQLTPNTSQKIVHVRNSLSGSRSIIFFQGTYNASNDYELASGKDALLVFDGAGAGATVTDMFQSISITGADVTTLSIGGAAITATAAELNYNDITTLGTVEASKAVTADGSGNINFSSGNMTNVDIDSGTIDGTTVGAASASTGAFTTLTTTSTIIATGNVTGANLSGTNTGDEVQATTTTQGVIELATQAEVDTGTDTDRAVTPSTLANYSGLGGGGTTLSALTDTTITTVGNDEVLQYTGSVWENQTLAEAGIAPVASPTFTGTLNAATVTASGNVTGANLSGTNTGDEVQATATTQGVIELATQAEVDAGTDTDRAVTPSTLANYSGLGGGGTTLSALTDTTITTVGNDEVLQYTGSVWENQTLAEAGIAPVASPTFTGTVAGPTINASTQLQIGGTAITATAVELNYNDITTLGTVQASKVVTADGSGNINFADANMTNVDIDSGTMNGITIEGSPVGTSTADTGRFTTIEATTSLTTAGTVNFTGATVSNLGTVTTADINGGTIDGATINNSAIGGTTPAAATFTNLTASGTINFSGGTVSNLGTVSTADINGGTIDGTAVGASSASTGKFTSLTIGAEVSETEYSLTGTDIDPANGTIQYKTLSGSTTFTFNAGWGNGESLTLFLDAAGNTVTWPTMEWIGGSAPTSEASNTMVIVLTKQQGTYVGTYIGLAS